MCNKENKKAWWKPVSHTEASDFTFQHFPEPFHCQSAQIELCVAGICLLTPRALLAPPPVTSDTGMRARPEHSMKQTGLKDTKCVYATRTVQPPHSGHLSRCGTDSVSVWTSRRGFLHICCLWPSVKPVIHLPDDPVWGPEPSGSGVLGRICLLLNMMFTFLSFNKFPIQK